METEKTMTIDELIAELKRIKAESDGDREEDHLFADYALLVYINDPRVTEAFDDIEKWYA